MSKFVYNFAPNGKDYFMKATDLKSAKQQLRETFGKVHFVGETKFKSAKRTTNQFEFELNQL